jgi:hypothetical protein
MFRPNKRCTLRKSGGKTDVFGQPIPTETREEWCAIVTLNLRNEKSSVRADTSASRGAAREFQVDAVLLMTQFSQVRIDDVIEIEGVQLRVVARFPRHDLQGRLDHYEIGGTYWSERA